MMFRVLIPWFLTASSTPGSGHGPPRCVAANSPRQEVPEVAEVFVLVAAAADLLPGADGLLGGHHVMSTWEELQAEAKPRTDRHCMNNCVAVKNRLEHG